MPAAANGKASGHIDVVDFVAEAEVDPTVFVKPYFLLPQGRDVKTYVLLREVLRRSKRVEVAKVVLRTPAHLALMRIYGGGLMLSLLRFAHELRPADTFASPRAGSEGGKITARELKVATSLVQSMTTTFRPRRYRDDYREDLLKRIARKRRAGDQKLPPVAKKAPPAGQNVVDIVALLQQSVSSARGGTGAKKPAPAKRQAASGPVRGRAASKRAASASRARPAAMCKARRTGAS